VRTWRVVGARGQAFSAWTDLEDALRFGGTVASKGVEWDLSKHPAAGPATAAESLRIREATDGTRSV
jgi:hypothetical protein